MALEFGKARVPSALWPASASLGVKTTLSYPDGIFGSCCPAAESIKSSSWTVLARPQSWAAGWLQDSRAVCQWRGEWREPGGRLSLACGGTLVAVFCLPHVLSSCIFTQESSLGSKLQFIFQLLFEVSRPFVGLWVPISMHLGSLASDTVRTAGDSLPWRVGARTAELTRLQGTIGKWSSLIGTSPNLEIAKRSCKDGLMRKLVEGEGCQTSSPLGRDWKESQDF